METLSASLKEMEIEKNNAEYALSRRQDEVVSLNASLQSLKSEEKSTKRSTKPPSMRIGS